MRPTCGKHSVWLFYNATEGLKMTAAVKVNPRSLLEKIVTRSLEGRGGQSEPPPPSTFDIIHPIYLQFGTYSKLHLCFQLSETT